MKAAGGPHEPAFSRLMLLVPAPDAVRVRVAFASAMAFIVAVLAGFVQPEQARGSDPELSAEELARLEAGELVVRPTSEARGTLRLIGGTAFQLVEASPEMLWRALLDVRYYHRTLPQVSKARIADERAGVRTVFLRHGTVPLTASYYLTMKLDPKQRDISFKLDHTRPHDIQAAWGFYSLRPHASGRTLVMFGVLADPGAGVVRALMRSSIHEWLLKVPWMVKRFVETSGRYIYRPRRSAGASSAAGSP